MSTKPSTVQLVLVTIRSDGRYSDKELADHVGNRMWNLDGVDIHGVDAQFVARVPINVEINVKADQRRNQCEGRVMPIILAPLIYVRSRRHRGHCGEVTEYVVSVKTDKIEFYPVEHMGYDTPSFGRLDFAQNWAAQLSEALGFEIVEELHEPKATYSA